ncbi:hypothetical protein [Parafrigoribacterium humi]|jgi:uncharacterized membrane protein
MSAFVLLSILIYVVTAVIILWIVWAIIRSAVRRALRDHQEWLEERGLR